MRYILVTGNPNDGLSYTGPFASANDVIDYAELQMGLDIDWWFAPISAPISADKEDAYLIKYISDSLKNKQIRYKDGNSKNYDIDNLELVDKQKDTFEFVSQELFDRVIIELEKEEKDKQQKE